MANQRLVNMIERCEMLHPYPNIMDAMKTKEYTKLQEYYIRSKDTACTDHWIVLIGSSPDGSLISFGCLACGYREDWQENVNADLTEAY